MTGFSACDRPQEMKRHFATTGSISDFVGDRVQGWDRSSSLWTRFGVTRIGFGAAITLSWLPVGDVLDKGGGVFRRGTPAAKNIS